MATVTLSSVNSSTTSQAVVSANVSRSGVTLVNTDGNRCYFRLGTSAATTTSGGFTDYLDENDVAYLDGDEAEQAIQAIWSGDGSGGLSVTQTITEQLSGASATSILGIIQQICKRPLGIEPPDALYASTDRTAQELAEVANAALDMINRAHRWRKLVQRATYTGDGSTVDYDLPDDYGFMPDDQQVWSSTAQIPLLPVHSLDDWLAMDVRNFNPGTNAWIIYGGQIHFTPALDSGEVANHFYQSTASVQPATGNSKSTFTLDTDTFRIDDELLRKAIIYLWKQDKGLPYAEFQNDYEILKEKLIARDKGATIMRQGRARWPKGVNLAYPLTVPGGT
jgi:hypothetical protein